MSDQEREAYWSAVESKRWVLLGINGEFFERPASFSGVSEISLLLAPAEDGIDLISGYTGTRCGHIDRDGYVIFDPVVRGLHSTSKTIKRWKAPLTKAGTINLGESKLLEAPGQKKRKNMPAPEGTTGWAVLLAGGMIYKPPQDSARPENFLWIVEHDDTSFSFVHSGPLHSGVLITVKRGGIGGAYDIEYGESTKKFIEIPTTPRYWAPRYRENGVEVVMSDGGTGSIVGAESSYERVIFKDGELYATVDPPVQ